MKTLHFLLPGPLPRARQPLAPFDPRRGISSQPAETGPVGQDRHRRHVGAAHGPAIGSINGLHPQSKFLAIAAR